ncbi:MAG: hypothetical protein SOZ62_02150 [Eubacteriales bacterium]|nr:hypothetical protein [Eubacteriales bacterium]
MKYLLQPKKQYKVNLHAHTNISDGILSAFEIKALYKSHGYSAVAFTDHDILIRHNELTDSEFIALNGYEFKMNENSVMHAKERYKSFHMNFIARSPLTDTQVCFNPDIITKEAKRFIPFSKYDGEVYNYEYSQSGVCDVISRARAAGFIVNYNHPVWCMNTDAELCGIHGFCGVETMNTNSHRVKGLPEDTDMIYEGFLRRGDRPIPLGCDDNHNQYEYNSDSFGAFNMVLCDSLSYENIISALENGDTYASAGPLINEIKYDDGYVFLNVENTVSVMLRTEGRRAQNICDRDGLDIVRFKVKENDGYIRFVLTDKEGAHAYTRAYDLSDFT